VTENSVEGVDKKELLISENSSSSLSGKSYLVQSSLFDPPGKVKSVKINMSGNKLLTRKEILDTKSVTSNALTKLQFSVNLKILNDFSYL
jgi:hypothetical protein